MISEICQVKKEKAKQLLMKHGSVRLAINNWIYDPK